MLDGRVLGRIHKGGRQCLVEVIARKLNLLCAGREWNRAQRGSGHASCGSVLERHMFSNGHMLHRTGFGQEPGMTWAGVIFLWGVSSPVECETLG